MSKFKNIVSEETRSKIMQLFYRTEYRENEVIIDNQDESIAREVNLPTSTVSSVIARDLEKKIKEINSRIAV